MGWNSWNSFANIVNSQIVQQQAKALASNGMKEAGYEYVVIDEGWWLGERDAAGNIIVKLKQWPAIKPGQKDGASNYIDSSVRRDVFDGELGRLDYNISDRHKFFYSFRHNYRVEDRNNHYHNIATGNLLNRINWGSTLDDVYTFSPTTVMNIRANWTRFTEANDKPSAGFDFTQLGFPGYVAAASQRLVMPIIDLNQFSDWGDNAGDRTPFDTLKASVSCESIDVPEYQPLTDRRPPISTSGDTCSDAACRRR